jgi:zinc transport system substrate-binding protein
MATIFPLADMASRIGGESVEVKVLLPAGADPHTFEPRPSQIAAISRARVFIKVGAGLDFWVDKFVAAASRGGLVVVDSSAEMEIPGEELQGVAADEVRGNPHFWLDPISAMKIVDKITQAMAQADPPRAQTYRVNALEYKGQLMALDAEIRAAVSGFKRKEFVAFHSAWVLFARRYGLIQAAVIEPFPGKEPSPRYLAGVVKEARRIGARAIFAEPQLNPKAARVIAKEAGMKILYLDPIGGPGIKGRSSYLELMRHNLSVFKEALDG